MSARARLILDVGLFSAVLVANNPAWTGPSTHEWLSLAIITPLLVHLVVNWEWAVGIASRFAQRLRTVSRVNLTVDVGLFISSVTVMTSGLVVSRTIAGILGVSGGANAVWYVLHSLSADAAMLLLVIHLAMHWRWIARTLGLVRPRNTPTRGHSPELLPQLASRTFAGAGAREAAVQRIPVRPDQLARQR